MTCTRFRTRRNRSSWTSRRTKRRCSCSIHRTSPRTIRAVAQRTSRDEFSRGLGSGYAEHHAAALDDDRAAVAPPLYEFACITSDALNGEMHEMKGTIEKVIA